MRQQFVRFLDECQQQNLVKSSSPVGVRDMIRKKYYQALEPAVRTATTAEKEEIKSGLNVSLYYLLKRLAKVVKSTHLVSGNDDDAAKIDKFVDMLDLNKNYRFGDAVYEMRHNRETRLRKAQHNIQLLRLYTVRRCCRTRTSSGRLTCQWSYKTWPAVDCRCSMPDRAVNQRD